MWYRWPRWPALFAARLYGTGRRDAIRRIGEEPYHPGQHRHHAGLRQVTGDTLCSQGPNCKTSGWPFLSVSRSSPFRKADLATHCSGCARLILGSRRRGLGGTEGARTAARAAGDRGSSVDVKLVSLRVGNQDNGVRPQE